MTMEICKNINDNINQFLPISYHLLFDSQFKIDEILGGKRQKIVSAHATQIMMSLLTNRLCEKLQFNKKMLYLRLGTSKKLVNKSS